VENTEIEIDRLLLLFLIIALNIFLWSQVVQKFRCKQEFSLLLLGITPSPKPTIINMLTSEIEFAKVIHGKSPFGVFLFPLT
jgi:hypothetical protein